MGICMMAYDGFGQGWFLLGFGQGWFLLGVGSLWQGSVFWYGFQYCLVARVPPGSYSRSSWCLGRHLWWCLRRRLWEEIQKSW